MRRAFILIATAVAACGGREGTKDDVVQPSAVLATMSPTVVDDAGTSVETSTRDADIDARAKEPTPTTPPNPPCDTLTIDVSARRVTSFPAALCQSFALLARGGGVDFVAGYEGRPGRLEVAHANASSTGFDVLDTGILHVADLANARSVASDGTSLGIAYVDRSISDGFVFRRYVGLTSPPVVDAVVPDTVCRGDCDLRLAHGRGGWVASELATFPNIARRIDDAGTLVASRFLDNDIAFPVIPLGEGFASFGASELITGAEESDVWLWHADGSLVENNHLCSAGYGDVAIATCPWRDDAVVVECSAPSRDFVVREDGTIVDEEPRSTLPPDLLIPVDDTLVSATEHETGLSLVAEGPAFSARGAPLSIPMAPVGLDGRSWSAVAVGAHRLIVGWLSQPDPTSTTIDVYATSICVP